jgi:hypothetical protein
MSTRSSHLIYVKLAVAALVLRQFASAETIVLEHPVDIPIVVDGKKVGSTKAPAGTKLEVQGREGEKIQVKFRSFEPIWVEASHVGAEPKGPADSTSFTPTPSAFDPLRAINALESPGTNEITSLLRGREYPDPNAREELSTALATFIDAKTRIAEAREKSPVVEKEVKRLRRNAEVAGRPNALNPADTSGQERAQQIRKEADTIEREFDEEVSNAQGRLDQAKTILIRLFERWRTTEDKIREGEARLEEDATYDEVRFSPDNPVNPSKIPPVEAEEAASTESEYSDDVAALRAKAEAGNANAQYTLATWYYEGRQGLAVDWDAATPWAEQAAAQKHAGALFLVGMLRLIPLFEAAEAGEDTTDLQRSPEIVEAALMLAEAARQGDAEAAKVLANRFNLSIPVMVKYMYPESGIQLGTFTTIDKLTEESIANISPQLVVWVMERFKREPFYNRTVERSLQSACRSFHQLKKIANDQLSGDDVEDFKTAVEGHIQILYDLIAREARMDAKASIQQHLSE